MSFPFRIRRNRSRPFHHPVGAFVLIVGLVASFAGLATVSPANATLSGGSPFDAADGTLDDNAGPAHPDLPEGSGDDSYKGGAKEDKPCPDVEDGSVQDKGDLTDFYVATGEGDTDTFLYLAFDRIETSTQNGTVALNFELNQSTIVQPAPACNGVNPNRTAGDKLIGYEFHGSTPALGVLITVYTWDGEQWVDPVLLNDIAGASEGSISENRTFGEMAINLEKAGIFEAGRCDNFASVFVKGRSSSADALNSELKDLIAPVPQHIANCGPLSVSKTVVGGKVGDKFDFTVDCPGEADDESFSLMDGESKTFDDIPLEAECMVTETDPAMSAWWTTTYNIGAGSSQSGRSADVVIDAAGQSVAFNNAAKPNGIVLDKKVNGADHATVEDALIVHTLDNLTYTVVVTNNGQVPLTITALSDSLYSAFASSCAQGVGSALAVGASFTCTYQVPAGGDAHNVATSSAVDEGGRPVSDEDDTFVDVVPVVPVVPAVAPEVLGVVLELPRTGSPIGWACGMALLLVVGGFTLRRMGRRSHSAT